MRFVSVAPHRDVVVSAGIAVAARSAHAGRIARADGRVKARANVGLQVVGSEEIR
jgi:hypothetical protein